MPSIYVRWILRIFLRFGNKQSKMCSFADFNRPILDICTNLHKNHRIGEQIIFVVMELLNNSHHIREIHFVDFSQIWK